MATKPQRPRPAARSRPIEGEFYFVIKVQPVNAPAAPRFGPRFVGTIHKTDSPTATTKGSVKRNLVVTAPEWQSKSAFKFVVQDMNENLDTLALTKNAVKTAGQQWLANSVDHAIIKVVIGAGNRITRKKASAKKSRGS